MGEDDDRGRRWAPGKIRRQPLELLSAKIAHAARLQIGDIDQGDEVYAAMIEAVPAGALAALTEAVEEGFAAVGIEHVMLAGNEKDRQSGGLQHLLGVVEFFVARELRDIAGVDDEIGLDG